MTSASHAPTAPQAADDPAWPHWIRLAAIVAGVIGWLVLACTVGAAPVARGAAFPSSSAAAKSAKAQSGAANVYRFFNRTTGTHFYTIDETDRAIILANWPQFADEGPSWRALKTPVQGTIPVYRFFNRQTGAHFYTSSAAERQRVLLTLPDYADEGVAFNAYAGDAVDHVAVHRFYNTKTRTHFYTASEADRDTVLRLYPWFTYEGVAYYGIELDPGPVQRLKLDAFRLLDQATFGPTTPEVNRVMAMGAAAWVEEQLAMPPSGYPGSEFNYESLYESDSCKFSAPRDSPIYRCAEDQLTLFKFRNRFFQNALSRPDQLRQRVAWALSQIFVISGMKDPDMETAYVQARYHDMLANEAFGNFETLLVRVTLSPAMGHYLDMVNNAKADPVEMTEPNENYARELLQLFSIGVVELRRDGTPLLDGQGQPVATYSQAEVRAFARALTGWTYPQPATLAKHEEEERFYAGPMVVATGRHDAGAKQLLRGISLPAGLAPDTDLSAALSNVFLHPNVAPFIGRQLIRHLVTGSPSPAYVDRVATVFEDNGAGARGDLKAVVRAILLDPEARTAPDANPRYGRLREPAQFITGVLRALGAASDGIGLDDMAKAMGQNVFYSPSVFNYFPAEYKIPGTDVTAPAMGIHNTNTVLARSNFIVRLLWHGGLEPDDEITGAIGTRIDLRAYTALAGDPRKLLADIDQRLYGGSMPFGVKSVIFDAISAIDADDPEERARTALFLAATAFQYQVSR